MTDPIKALASSPSSTADRRGQGDDANGAAPVIQTPAATPKAKAEDEQPLRLVIEPSGNASGYVYKLFDRVTGRLLVELPRDAAEKMGAEPDYTAGQVFSAKV